MSSSSPRPARKVVYGVLRGLGRDEAALAANIVELAKAYGRQVYGRIAALLRHAGTTVNVKPVQRVCRWEGRVPRTKQAKRGRLWRATAYVCALSG